MVMQNPGRQSVFGINIVENLPGANLAEHWTDTDCRRPQIEGQCHDADDEQGGVRASRGCLHATILPALITRGRSRVVRVRGVVRGSQPE